MKKNKFLLFVFLLVYVNLNARVIEQTYYFDNYQVAQIDNYQTINFTNTLLTGKTGEPVLPYQSISLLIPPGEIAESIEIIGEEETTIPGNFKGFQAGPYHRTNIIRDLRILLFILYFKSRFMLVHRE